MMINQRSPVSEKIALFRSLFCGRIDVYPRRFQNQRTQKSGYAPACKNEWVRHVCQKPKIKCHDCPHRQFIPVTDDQIRWHLQGRDNSNKEFVMGIYPMLLDDTCFFLAVDFDKANWEMDAKAFFTTCQQMKLPAALERSRSGEGAHIWLFFSENIPAILARKLGSIILTETMERHRQLGLDSYDRFFPNQDTLPKGGFGNLIALPMQKKARKKGNSIFVDESLNVIEDQWAYLASLQKISRKRVEALVDDAEKQGRVLGVRLDVADEENPTPWKPMSSRSLIIPSEDLPKKITLVLANEIFIEKQNIPQSLLNRFIRMAAFQNPAFYKAQAMRLPVYEIPRIIGCAYDYSHHLGLPRGCVDEIKQLLKELKIKYTLQDELFSGKILDVYFQGALRSEQENAAATLLQSDIGVLSATTAFGKTVVAAYLIAKRKANTLIIVHTKQLQDQWAERLQTFLKMPDKTIGRLGGGRKKVTGLIDVVLIQSLVRKEDLVEFIGQYGYVIIDECHHVPSVNFDKVMRHVKARFITGLSATVIRKDGHHPIITMRCGPIRYRVNAKQQAIERPFEHHVMVRPTAFCPEKILQEDLRLQFQDLCNEIINDEKRNQLICDDVINAVEKGRSPIVLTERNEHLDLLYNALSSKIEHLIVLCGSLSKREMIDAINRLKSISSEEHRVILATGRFVGEGFDDARLDTLFLTLPISWKGTIAQYSGRLHRLYDLKKEVLIYDYADFSVPMLERMFNRRCKAYEAIGYEIIMPASAYHGWPAAVSLPADPIWKMNFTNTMQRLIRDGVDSSLAKLFADHSSQNINIDRARSHVEAFLFYRLETLEETKGRFQLNHHLSIPFDGLGKMEVDFLCADSNVVIEIDGMQHLSSAEAYRRDRRKDMLLQENGYKILRFLAEDVMKQLDLVLDVILRAISKK